LRACSGELPEKRKMRFIRDVAFVSLIVLFAATGCVRKGPRETNLALAIVGETKIRESDFRQELERVDPSLRSKFRKDRMAFLNRMIEEEVIYQKAVEENLSQDPEAKKRLAWAEEDIAIERLKELEIYAKVTVSEKEIEKRYGKEVTSPEESEIVKSILYISNYQDLEPREVISLMEKGLGEGLSFPEIAERYTIAYDTMAFDSPNFSQLPAPIPNVTRKMPNRTVVAFPLGGMPWYFVKDVEPLSSCFRRVRRAIRDEKREHALREWLSSRSAGSTIRVYEEALEDMEKSDAVVAEVNDVPIQVGDLRMLRETLSAEEKSEKQVDQKALLDKAIDREILRQEAWRRKLQEDKTVKEKMATETRRILVEILTERKVTGYAESVRVESRKKWVEGLKRAAGVQVFAERVKKMRIPPSKEIQDVFGVQRM